MRCLRRGGRCSFQGVERSAQRARTHFQLDPAKLGRGAPHTDPNEFPDVNVQSDQQPVVQDLVLFGRTEIEPWRQDRSDPLTMMGAADFIGP